LRPGTPEYPGSSTNPLLPDLGHTRSPGGCLLRLWCLSLWPAVRSGLELSPVKANQAQRGAVFILVAVVKEPFAAEGVSVVGQGRGGCFSH
jgi:hypothetical protein